MGGGKKGDCLQTLESQKVNIDPTYLPAGAATTATAGIGAAALSGSCSGAGVHSAAAASIKEPSK
jgi:hypothetical protein